mgnify:CR=1 FL=1
MGVGLEAVCETLENVYFVDTLAAPEKPAEHTCVILENGLT